MDRCLCCCRLSLFQHRHEEIGEALLPAIQTRQVYGALLDSEQYALLESTYFYEYKWREMQYDSIGGWKIHIALTNNLEQISLAWRLILPILVRYNLGNFKIAKEGFLTVATQGPDQGKVITLYLAYNSEFRVDGSNHAMLQEMLLEIDQILRSNHIEAGNRSSIDSLIAGSAYFSYRCDAGNRPGAREGTLLPMDAQEAAILSSQHGYSLAVMSHFTSENEVENPTRGNIYLNIESGMIKYQVINLDGVSILGYIDVIELGGLSQQLLKSCTKMNISQGF